MKLTAACVTCQTIDGSAMLGFADHEFDTTEYVLLESRLTPPSPQALEAGLVGPHIEINDQLHSGYGGVISARLQENRLILKLDSQSAAEMGVDDTIMIDFRLSEERLREISNQLRLMLGDDKVQIELNV